MLSRVVSAKPLEGYQLWLEFDDGKQGTIDLKEQLWGPVFEPLKDQTLFQQVAVDSELATIVWPNGADFAPDFLYEQTSAASVSKST